MSEHEGRVLPPFPVDDFTLDQLEHALDTCLGDVREDGSHELVGGEFTLSKFLEFMSGYEPDRCHLIGYTDTIPGTDIPTEGAIPIYEHWDQSYTERCVIRALVAEIRRLRASVVSEGNHHA